MALIEVDDLEPHASSSGARPGGSRRTRDEVLRGARPDVRRRAPARWSATSAPTAPASRPPSRCSPASWCRPAGSSRVAGLDPSRRRTELARRIGVVFGQRTTLWWDLPLRDSFALLQKIYRTDPDAAPPQPRGVRRAARPRRPARHPGAAAQPGPADARRHRGGAAARPRDPLPRRADHRPRRDQQGPAARVPPHPQRRPARTTLLLTTHDLQDIEALCRPGDRDRPRHRGLRRASADLHLQGGSTRTLVVDLVDEAPPISVPGATTRQVEGPRQWLSFPTDASAAPIVAAVAAAYDVADLSIQEPDIEDVIRDLYSR